MAGTVAATAHGLLAAGTCVLLYYAMKYAKKYYTMAAFLLPPFVCFCMIYENIVRAATNLDVSGGGIDKNLPSVQVMLALQSCIIPFMLLICFEVTYLVHKNKSVNFCGISFESGHRANRNNFKTTFLRFAVWLVGLSLLLINLYVYYHYFNSLELREGSYLINGDGTASTILTEIPAYVLVILSLYMGLRLWNYGCNYAFVIHATCFNPWIWMVVGAIGLAIGYTVPGALFAVTSNIGEFAMLTAIIRMFKEVHHDLQVADEFGPTMDRSLRDQPSAVVVPRPLASDASSSSPMSAYVPLPSPAESDGERLTDANTNAYFSEVIARTKVETRWEPPVPPRIDPVVLAPVRSRPPEPVVEAPTDPWIVLEPAFDQAAWVSVAPQGDYTESAPSDEIIEEEQLIFEQVLEPAAMSVDTTSIEAIIADVPAEAVQTEAASPDDIDAHDKIPTNDAWNESDDGSTHIAVDAEALVEGGVIVDGADSGNGEQVESDDVLRDEHAWLQHLGSSLDFNANGVVLEAVVVYASLECIPLDDGSTAE
ncbi:hypothetical protein ACHHYP_09802 [Achlya hypogyna]|uniref:Uncharacterized protein n=1 Tax=Achlya hypogyna TaxID=1202772 RepID=A0A1V9YME8_ACHHY|nr:hypothetical protein ACHHYP_09802 [Achlya hypogyna]